VSASLQVLDRSSARRGGVKPWHDRDVRMLRFSFVERKTGFRPATQPKVVVTYSGLLLFLLLISPFVG
jgi:hypothetical protein